MRDQIINWLLTAFVFSLLMHGVMALIVLNLVSRPKHDAE